MRKLLELTVLAVTMTGFYTVKFPSVLSSSISFFSLVNVTHKDSNIKTKYLANNQDNDKIKSNGEKFINPPVPISEKSLNLGQIKFKNMLLEFFVYDKIFNK